MHDLGSLYAECAQRIAQQVYLVVQDEQIATRAVHDAFARAGSEWESAQLDPSPEGWVRAEAVRMATGPKAKLVLTCRRLRARRRRDGGRHRAAGPASTEADARLLDVLTGLPTVQVTALVLHHVAGLGLADIASEMESTVAAAATRIRSAEGAVATATAAADREDIARGLAGLAQRAHLPLLAPARAQGLPERRTRRALGLTGSAAATVGLVLGLAAAVGGDESPSLTSAVVTGGTPAAATAEPTPARVSTSPARPRASGSPGSFLPERDSAPNLARVPSSRRDFGYVRGAFRHGEQVYVELDRAQVQAGGISNASSRLRIFPVAANAFVEPGRQLSADPSGSPISVAEFLRLVLSGDGEKVPVKVRYDNGEIESFAEVT